MPIQGGKMKFLITISILFTSHFVLAADDVCLSQLTAKFQKDAKSSPDWGFDDLVPGTQTEALDAVEFSLAEMSDDEREANIKLAKENDKSFYFLYWNAPANSGSSLIIADSNTCDVLSEIVVSSEE